MGHAYGVMGALEVTEPALRTALVYAYLYSLYGSIQSLAFSDFPLYL